MKQSVVNKDTGEDDKDDDYEDIDNEDIYDTVDDNGGACEQIAEGDGRRHATVTQTPSLYHQANSDGAGTSPEDTPPRLKYSTRCRLRAENTMPVYKDQFNGHQRSIARRLVAFARWCDDMCFSHFLICLLLIRPVYVLEMNWPEADITFSYFINAKAD